MEDESKMTQASEEEERTYGDNTAFSRDLKGWIRFAKRKMGEMSGNVDGKE